MSEKSVGQLFTEGVIQAVARALVYGVAVVLATVLFAGTVKQEIKEGIEYSVQSALSHTSAVLVEDEVLHGVVLPKIKQNTKEAIEYAIVRANREWAFPRAAKDTARPSKP